MKIVHIWRDLKHRWEINQWRGESFVRAINSTGRHKAWYLEDSEFIKTSAYAKRMCEQADLLVIHQDLWGERLKLIQFWKARGKIILADLHFSIESMDTCHPEFDFWTNGLVDDISSSSHLIVPSRQFKWGLQLVDGVTTFDQKIINECIPFAPVFEIPNYIELNRYRNILPVQHPGITIGWKMFSPYPFQQAEYYQALVEILQERSDVHLAVFSDELTLDDFPGISRKSLSIIPVEGGSNWPKPLAHVDIGFTPGDPYYNLGNDGIDHLEWITMGIPWISCKERVSPSAMNYGLIADHSRESWKRLIQTLVDQLPIVKAKSKREAYLIPYSQSLEENVHQLIGTYAKIIHQVNDRKQIVYKAQHISADSIR